MGHRFGWERDTLSLSIRSCVGSASGMEGKGERIHNDAMATGCAHLDVADEGEEEGSETFYTVEEPECDESYPEEGEEEVESGRIAVDPPLVDPRPCPKEAQVQTPPLGQPKQGSDDIQGSEKRNEGNSSVEGTSLGLDLPPGLEEKLYQHQKEGVGWMQKIHHDGQGGILGDDMGLGKTMQVSAFLAGKMHAKVVRRVLVVAPKTLLAHWDKELALCHLSEKTHQYTQGSEGEANIKHVGKHGGILLTTYGMVLHNANQLRDLHGGSRRDQLGKTHTWDYVVLDEGHKIKNPNMQLAQAIRTIPAGHRIIISGTPIQNNLQELWALFDFTNPGLLGGLQSFKEKFEKPILRGNDRDAFPEERKFGARKAAELRSIIAPYFLRRDKKEVFGEQQTDTKEDTPAGVVKETVQPAPMGRKSDMIVWLKLSKPQRSLYTAFLQGTQVQTVLNESGSALVALNTLKKICDHPSLLSERATMDIKASQPSNQTEWDALLSSTGSGLKQKMDLGIEEVVNDSCKTQFLMQLLHVLIQQGHRTLVFSRSKRMLNIVERAVRAEGHTLCRVDGDISSAFERQARVDQFQSDANIPVFLLTSGVGGLGLTLTAADRVVILDPAWNPATDNQSVDRAYRIGQEKHVVIYRLITCGTVEEKQYRRQVFKEGLSRTGMKEGEQMRYFSKNELREFFHVSVDKLDSSETDCQIIPMHGGEQAAMKKLFDAGLEGHIQELKEMGVAAVSDHTLLFSKAPAQEETQRPIAPRKTPKKGPQLANWQGSSNIVAAGSSMRSLLRKADAEPTPRYADCQAAVARMPLIQKKEENSPEEPDQRTIEIDSKIQRLSRLLKDSTVINRLPDRGATLKKTLADLEDSKKTILQNQNQAEGNNQEQSSEVDKMFSNLRLT